MTIWWFLLPFGQEYHNENHQSALNLRIVGPAIFPCERAPLMLGVLCAPYPAVAAAPRLARWLASGHPYAAWAACEPCSPLSWSQCRVHREILSCLRPSTCQI